MAIEYFKFKKFVVNQDRTAMKITTDSVLLGAWCNPIKAKEILDVGTGTGVISLMLAQKSNANITAIDIDISSCIQAEKNFINSGFKNAFHAVHSSLQEFAVKTNKKFDLIVSNPPFFNKSMRSTDIKIKNSRHDDFLTKNELFDCVRKLLTNYGIFDVIIPYYQKTKLIELAHSHGLYPQRIMNIKPNIFKHPKRVMIEFASMEKDYLEETISIETDKRHSYSKEYIELTKDYYLFIP
ncbi:MAG: methyltransferase [Marinilabiliales bacterium]